MEMRELAQLQLARSSSSGLSLRVSLLVLTRVTSIDRGDAVVAGMIVYGVWDSCVRGNNRRPPHAGNGYGGGWGGDDNGKASFDSQMICTMLTYTDDPPPPYTPYGKPSSSRSYGTQNGQAWRPGFWTGAGAGAAAGAAAGYMAGNRGNASNRSNSNGWGGSTGSSSPTPSSSRYESTGFGSSSRR